jgi:hypothetical protein
MNQPQSSFFGTAANYRDGSAETTLPQHNQNDQIHLIFGPLFKVGLNNQNAR